ncbi:MAG TPA: CHC2 zinc finger domain-containing protein [Candidatus Saccharimonadales bacterium]|nr:CHC2 zinc finger domain-containing protein [Candidatus Saccharimonadales bacterium]
MLETRYGVRVLDIGGVWLAVCPLHSDPASSMIVYPGGAFACHECAASGDVIDLVQLAEGQADRGAAERCLADLGWRLDQRSVKPPSPSPEHLDILELAAELYAYELESSREAQSFLRSYGLQTDWALRNGLGYCSGGNLINELKSRDLPPEVARELGLLNVTDSGERLHGRLILSHPRGGPATWLTGFPVGDPMQAYVSVRARRPIFGWAPEFNEKCLVVVDTPFAAAVISSFGVPAVALHPVNVRAGLEVLRGAPTIEIAVRADQAAKGRAWQAALGENRSTMIGLMARTKTPADWGRSPGGRRDFLTRLYRARRLNYQKGQEAAVWLLLCPQCRQFTTGWKSGVDPLPLTCCGARHETWSAGPLEGVYLKGVIGEVMEVRGEDERGRFAPLAPRALNGAPERVSIPRRLPG